MPLNRGPMRVVVAVAGCLQRQSAHPLSWQYIDIYNTDRQWQSRCQLAKEGDSQGQKDQAVDMANHFAWICNLTKLTVWTSRYAVVSATADRLTDDL